MLTGNLHAQARWSDPVRFFFELFSARLSCQRPACVGREVSDGKPEIVHQTSGCESALLHSYQEYSLAAVLS